jgi:anaerobic dimethyl sulfoxide reductase subunit A
MTDSPAAAIPVSCNKDCGGECPLMALVRGGRVVRITHNPAASPRLAGCAKGARLHEALYAPDRLKSPLVRTGPRGSSQFKEVGWSHALDLVSDRLSDIQARHGNEAILHLGGSGACRGALHNTYRLTTRFLSLFGGYTETYGNYSSAAGYYATPFVLGTPFAGIDAATLQFSKLVILWGANPSDTRLGSETSARLREARASGVDVIVIDPHRSNTARELEAEWIPVLPGADVALMMAVLYVLLREKLVDRPFITRYSVGFEALEDHVLGRDDGQPKTPEWATGLCGTPPERIVELARRYGRSQPVALIPGLSIQRTIGGEEAIRMSIALQVATGNLGVLGGSSGALTWGKLPPPRVGRITSPGNPCDASVPVVRWPDAILEGRSGGYPSDIKAAYNVGGNFLVQGSDVGKNIRAFEALDFAVCHDYVLTPTARYSDVVLPATTPLEREDIIITSGGNYLLYAQQAVPPQHNSRNDYDIFCELADRLGFLDEYSEGRSPEQWLAHFLEDSEVPDVETFKRQGIYVAPDQLRVALSDFVSDPDAHPLATPSGRVEIASDAYAATGFPAIPTCRIYATSEEFPLRLVTPHPRFRIHSQGGGDLEVHGNREPHLLRMNTHDAGERGIRDGDLVLVRSPQGRLRIEATVTDDIMPGVASLCEGVWPRFRPDGVDVAGSANVLTSTEPTLPSHATRTHSVMVEVTPMAEGAS